MTNSELIAELEYEIFKFQDRIKALEAKNHELQKDAQKSTQDESTHAANLRIILTLQLGAMRQYVQALELRKLYAEGKPIEWTEIYSKKE